jgi:alpha-L-fucosidase 2
LEELCKHLLEPSEEQDLLAEPRLIGESNAPENSTWRLWYREPAEEVEKEGFLIGNGRSQVLVGGAINVERLILSEESCWTGGPGSVSKSTFSHSEDGFEYRGGNVAESEAQKQQEALQEFRGALKEQRVIRLSTPIVKTLQGDERGFGRPEAFGEVQIEEVHAFEKVENYRRELNLALGVVRVSFTVRGVKYTR